EERRVLLVLSEVTRTEALSRELDDLRRFGNDVIENMNSALVVVDLDGRVSYANPDAERILGESPVGESLWRWFEGALREKLVERTLREGLRFRGAEGLIARPAGGRAALGHLFAPAAGPTRGPRRPAPRRGVDLPGPDRDQAPPAPGAAHGEDGLDRAARGRRRARDQQPDGVHPRQPVPARRVRGRPAALAGAGAGAAQDGRHGVARGAAAHGRAPRGRDRRGGRRLPARRLRQGGARVAGGL